MNDSVDKYFTNVQVTSDLAKLSEYLTDAYTFIKLRFFLERLDKKVGEGTATPDDEQLLLLIHTNILQLNTIFHYVITLPPVSCDSYEAGLKDKE